LKEVRASGMEVYHLEESEQRKENRGGIKNGGFDSLEKDLQGGVKGVSQDNQKEKVTACTKKNCVVHHSVKGNPRKEKDI